MAARQTLSKKNRDTLEKADGRRTGASEAESFSSVAEQRVKRRPI
jgi:hypothetical protein